MGKEHSLFGEIIFTKDLDGVGPYLDPRQAISNKHIDKAAKEGGVKQKDLKKTLHDLSKHMGWDITKGSKTAN